MVHLKMAISKVKKLVFTQMPILAKSLIPKKDPSSYGITLEPNPTTVARNLKVMVGEFMTVQFQDYVEQCYKYLNNNLHKSIIAILKDCECIWMDGEAKFISPAKLVFAKDSSIRPYLYEGDGSRYEYH
jgi:hypothetical protein